MSVQDEQQREHEDDMRARLRRSESIEKAAVSSDQTSINLEITLLFDEFKSHLPTVHSLTCRRQRS